METVSHLIIVFISIALVNNLVLTKFLGICPYIGVSRRIDMAFGMGCAVTFVMTISGTVTWLINNLLLERIGMGYLKYIAFIMVIASMVQLVEMYVRKFFPAMYESFGIFLPLITTNCAILGTCLFIDLWGYGFLEAVVAGFGGGLGFRHGYSSSIPINSPAKPFYYRWQYKKTTESTWHDFASPVAATMAPAAVSSTVLGNTRLCRDENGNERTGDDAHTE